MERLGLGLRLFERYLEKGCAMDVKKFLLETLIREPAATLPELVSIARKKGITEAELRSAAQSLIEQNKIRLDENMRLRLVPGKLQLSELLALPKPPVEVLKRRTIQRVQQSLRVEGYDVSEEAIIRAFENVTGRPRGQNDLPTREHPRPVVDSRVKAISVDEDYDLGGGKECLLIYLFCDSTEDIPAEDKRFIEKQLEHMFRAFGKHKPLYFRWRDHRRRSQE